MFSGEMGARVSRSVRAALDAEFEVGEVLVAGEVWGGGDEAEGDLGGGAVKGGAEGDAARVEDGEEGAGFGGLAG